MRSLIYSSVDSLAITEQMVSEITSYGFFVGGIILAIMILERRMKFRGACLKFSTPEELGVESGE